MHQKPFYSLYCFSVSNAPLRAGGSRYTGCSVFYTAERLVSSFMTHEHCVPTGGGGGGSSSRRSNGGSVMLLLQSVGGG